MKRGVYRQGYDPDVRRGRPRTCLRAKEERPARQEQETCRGEMDDTDRRMMVASGGP